MAESIDELKKRVDRLHNIAYVIGALAVAFGVTGGFAINTLMNARAAIQALEKDVADSTKTFQRSREDQEKLLVAFAAQRLSDFDKHAQDKTTEVLAYRADLTELQKNALTTGTQVSVSNGTRCLDLATGDPTKVQAMDCRGGAPQGWKLTR